MSLRAMRERAGLTQVELSKRTGIANTRICDWERGLRNLKHAKMVTLDTLSDALDCDIYDLIEED